MVRRNGKCWIFNSGNTLGKFIPRADLYLKKGVHMKKWKLAGLFAMALMVSAAPLQALATSPEFAYTAEKWASLQDNKLEYGEIADLIHEYNTTVRQNELDYQKYKGKTSTDIAKEYYDSANEVSERISYPDDDSANYAGQISQALNSEISVDNLTEQGDNNVDDGEIKRLGYEQAEKSLVQQAQKLMISYYSGKASLDSLEDAVTQAETAYTQAQTRKSAGMALQSEVDNAAEAVTNAKASLQSAKSSLEQTRQQLIIMLGWNYNDSVEIGSLPDVDTSAVSSINVTSDIQTAIANNYSIKITERRLANSQSENNRAAYTNTLTNQKDTVSTNVKNAYNSLVLAKDSYEQAKTSYELAEKERAAAELRLSAGTTTKKTYAKQESACLSAKTSMESAKLSFFTAKVSYDWAVAGLASAS